MKYGLVKSSSRGWPFSSKKGTQIQAKFAKLMSDSLSKNNQVKKAIDLLFIPQIYKNPEYVEKIKFIIENSFVTGSTPSQEFSYLLALMEFNENVPQRDKENVRSIAEALLSRHEPFSGIKLLSLTTLLDNKDLDLSNRILQLLSSSEVNDFNIQQDIVKFLDFEIPNGARMQSVSSRLAQNILLRSAKNSSADLATEILLQSQSTHMLPNDIVDIIVDIPQWNEKNLKELAKHLVVNEKDDASKHKESISKLVALYLKNKDKLSPTVQFTLVESLNKNRNYIMVDGIFKILEAIDYIEPYAFLILTPYNLGRASITEERDIRARMVMLDMKQINNKPQGFPYPQQNTNSSSPIPSTAQSTGTANSAPAPQMKGLTQQEKVTLWMKDIKSVVSHPYTLDQTDRYTFEVDLLNKEYWKDFSQNQATEIIMLLKEQGKSITDQISRSQGKPAILSGQSAAITEFRAVLSAQTMSQLKRAQDNIRQALLAAKGAGWDINVKANSCDKSF